MSQPKFDALQREIKTGDYVLMSLNDDFKIGIVEGFTENGKTKVKSLYLRKDMTYIKKLSNSLINYSYKLLIVEDLSFLPYDLRKELEKLLPRP